MFSYEDRIRAVQLYLKLGKRIGATIRQLGYPTRNSLKAWHYEYEQCMIYGRAMSVRGRGIPMSRTRWPSIII
jgi:transposase-like protein